MKKLAIFMEGQTEKIFVRRLLEEIAGKHNIAIVENRITGKKDSRITTLEMSDSITNETKYYVLLYDSGGEGSVVSDMRDQYGGLIRSGYDKIIGLRDVYPLSFAQKGSLENGLNAVLPKGTLPAYVVLAVMEIEAWFLAEWHHFSRVSQDLTIALIEESLGFNPKVDDMEVRHHPAEDLHQIYKLIGRSYKKNKKQVNAIVSSLDYEFLYLELVDRVPSFGKLVNYINSFLVI
ncbi:MAG: DUF4276 family protein [Spirulina sp. DLM2.Bin59]|nr:MAG: DUF4276 family protein [Spirulina sp. DLM2.Bin59]